MNKRAMYKATAGTIALCVAGLLVVGMVRALLALPMAWLLPLISIIAVGSVWAAIYFTEKDKED